ncbi:hypothetical protein ABW636_18135 [Aquimarina sp. 2201CG1-2-11]|uniref:hypothetical protein n=1 Tax=Aquimarina discodermiae TaxID=3231043 RepID=UPI0034625197
MKKQILNLGKTLSKKAQQQINGGGASPDCHRLREGDSCGPNLVCQRPDQDARYLICVPYDC